MKENKNEVNILDEVNKGSYMGMDAISFILDKIENKTLYKVLQKQYKEYEKITKKIAKLYPEYKNKKPHETSPMDKLMLKMGIDKEIISNGGDSKLVELLLKGTNMGIIEGRKLLNHNTPDNNIHRLLEEYINMQEKNIEDLKKFL